MRHNVALRLVVVAVGFADDVGADKELGAGCADVHHAENDDGRSHGREEKLALGHFPAVLRKVTLSEVMRFFS